MSWSVQPAGKEEQTAPEQGALAPEEPAEAMVNRLNEPLEPEAPLEGNRLEGESVPGVDPNLFAVDGERLFEVLLAIIVLSFFIERALAVVFEAKPLNAFRITLCRILSVISSFV